MKQILYHIFETALGPCGLAWSDAETGRPAVVYLQLPCATAEQTEERLAARGRRSETCPENIAAVLEKIRMHLQGRLQDFSAVPLDLQGLGPFSLKVLAACREIRPGTTLSYGELARLIDHPGAARAVGQALAKNPIPLIIPCHRVLAANGGMVGFSAPGGVKTKARLLQLEGVALTIKKD